MNKFYLVGIGLGAISGSFIILSLFSSPTNVIYFEINEQCEHFPLDNLPIETPESNPELVIKWEDERLLKWNDFRGEPIEGKKSDACTHTWIRYRYNYELNNNTENPSFNFTNFTSEAYFRTYDSWVMPSVFELDTEIQNRKLIHEQGHFDIAEEYSRKMIQTLNTELMGKEYSINGTTKNEQSVNAEKIARQIINNVTNGVFDEWHEDDRTYDSKSDHMWNDSIQKEYNKRFDKLRH